MIPQSLRCPRCAGTGMQERLKCSSCFGSGITNDGRVAPMTILSRAIFELAYAMWIKQ